MTAVTYFETLGTTRPPTRRHTPEDQYFQLCSYCAVYTEQLYNISDLCQTAIQLAHSDDHDTLAQCATGMGRLLLYSRNDGNSCRHLEL
jgi:hypothetical protein